MAVLYISEHGGDIAIGKAQCVVMHDQVIPQTVAIGVSSAASAAFNARTRIIRVHADSICSVWGGPNPTATTSHPRMVAGQTEYFGVNPGDKIAVIANT